MRRIGLCLALVCTLQFALCAQTQTTYRYDEEQPAPCRQRSCFDWRCCTVAGLAGVIAGVAAGALFAHDGADDGSEGPTGPPGPTGPMGNTGPAGPAFTFPVGDCSLTFQFSTTDSNANLIGYVTAPDETIYKTAVFDDSGDPAAIVIPQADAFRGAWRVTWELQPGGTLQIRMADVTVTPSVGGDTLLQNTIRLDNLEDQTSDVYINDCAVPPEEEASGWSWFGN